MDSVRYPRVLSYLAYLQGVQCVQDEHHSNTALLCTRINTSRLWSSKICAALFIWLILRGEFFAALLGAPKFLIHTWEFMTNFTLNPKEISKLNSRRGYDPMYFWYIELGSVAISLIYYCWRVGFPLHE